MKPSHLDTQNVGFFRVKKIIRDEFVHDSEMKLNNAYSKRYQTRISSTRLCILKFQWIDWPHNQDIQNDLLMRLIRKYPLIEATSHAARRLPKQNKGDLRNLGRDIQDILEITVL